MPSGLLLMFVATALIIIGVVFLLPLFRNRFFRNTASNMNKVRDALVKANKNKTYRVGIYAEGCLSEVFLAMLKNSLQKYKLPVVFTRLHREAGRNLLVEGEWFNKIAYPDGEIVDMLIVMEVYEDRKEPANNSEMCLGVEARFYYPNGACAECISPVNYSTSMRWLSFEVAITIARVLRLIVIHPTPAPCLAYDPNIWPYEEREQNYAWPQKTPH